MKVRRGFVTNSSSSSFIFKNNAQQSLTKETVIQLITDKLEEAKEALHKVQDYIQECKDNNTPTAIYLCAEQEVKGFYSHNYGISYDKENLTETDKEYAYLINDYELRDNEEDDLDINHLTDGKWGITLIDTNSDINNLSDSDESALVEVYEWYSDKYTSDITQEVKQYLMDLGDVILYFEDGPKPPYFVEEYLETLSVHSCTHMG